MLCLVEIYEIENILRVIFDSILEDICIFEINFLCKNKFVF